MANNLSALQIQQIQYYALQAVLTYVSSFGNVAPIRTGEQGEVRVSRGVFGGVAKTLAKNATTAEVSNLATFENVFGTAHRYVQHRVPSFKVIDDKGLQAIGQALGQVWIKNIDLEIGSGLEGLLVANSPRIGTDVGCVGAGKKFFDTGKKGLIGEAGEFTYANLIAASLGEAALDSAIQLIIGAKDDRGLPLHLGRTGNLALVHASANVSTATKLTGSTVTDADLQKNWRNGLFNGGLVPWEFEDPDVALVVDTDVTPFFYHLAGMPNIDVGNYEAMFTTFTVEYDGTFAYSPYEDGAVALQAE